MELKKMFNKIFASIKQSFSKLLIFIKQNYKIFLFILLFSFLNCIFLMATYNGNISLTSKRFVFILFFLFITTLSLCFLILFLKYKNWKIENIFLIIGSILGILYLFIIPIGRAPDEPVHIYKTYSIAQGNLINENQNGKNGNYLPKNIFNISPSKYDQNNAYFNIINDLNVTASEEQYFGEILNGNPIDYFPQTIGMFIGITLNLPILITIFLGRLCGLIFCIVVTYFCLKFIPILKKSLFFISCLPLTMQTFISISYDGVIFCSAIILITFALYCIYNKSFKIKKRHQLLLAVTSILLIAAKPVYFPIYFLLFFIPSSCFKNKKHKILFLILSIILSILVFLFWSCFSNVAQPGNGADTSGQISFITSNPLEYIAILCQNILNMPIRYLERFSTLEWYSVSTSELYLICTLIFFVFLCINEFLSTNTVFSKSFRLATIACFFLSLILIFTALYIQWTPVGTTIIEGVQSRYFLPILILIPLICLPPNRKKIPKEILAPISDISIYCFLIFVNINMLSNILCVHI